MRPTFTGSRKSINLRGIAVPQAEDRQKLIPGFDQYRLLTSHVLCVGAGGIISHIAPTLVRKGIGRITLIDADVVEPSNLNRQRFYAKDIGENKAVALASNLFPECILQTEICGLPMRFEEAIARQVNLTCDLAICGVDNNPARVAASRFFRRRGTPVIFTAVSRDADHGYVFIQQPKGPCIACLFPDITDDKRYPCPGTPAIADILQSVGSLAVYAIDTLLMSRVRTWNYRRIGLADGLLDTATMISIRSGCRLCSTCYENSERRT